MKRISFTIPASLLVLAISTPASAGEYKDLRVCEYSRDGYQSESFVVKQPARVGGCIGHLSGMTAGLVGAVVLTFPVALLGMSPPVEMTEALMQSGGEAGNRIGNRMFGYPGHVSEKYLNKSNSK